MPEELGRPERRSDESNLWALESLQRPVEPGRPGHRQPVRWASTREGTANTNETAKPYWCFLLTAGSPYLAERFCRRRVFHDSAATRGEFHMHRALACAVRCLWLVAWAGSSVSGVHLGFSSRTGCAINVHSIGRLGMAHPGAMVPRVRPAEPKDAGRAGEREKEYASAYCPCCSARLAQHSCKLICPTCGYYMSCSDFY